MRYQEARIQELPDQVPIGHIPRSMTVQCRGGLTRVCSPGEGMVSRGAGAKGGGGKGGGISVDEGIDFVGDGEGREIGGTRNCTHQQPRETCHTLFI